mmetsp:Transcript_17067/g.37285  ORF Transcript_17067/g.37285 Transcript_17067/m.37285 type:complete len:243 (-) Transcript_17067:473-1201(-)
MLTRTLLKSNRFFGRRCGGSWGVSSVALGESSLCFRSVDTGENGFFRGESGGKFLGLKDMVSAGLLRGVFSLGAVVSLGVGKLEAMECGEPVSELATLSMPLQRMRGRRGERSGAFLLGETCKSSSEFFSRSLDMSSTISFPSGDSLEDLAVDVCTFGCFRPGGGGGGGGGGRFLAFPASSKPATSRASSNVYSWLKISVVSFGSSWPVLSLVCPNTSLRRLDTSPSLASATESIIFPLNGG